MVPSSRGSDPGLGAVKPKLPRVWLQSDRGQGSNYVGTGHPLLMGTPFMSEPHCLGEDSSQGHPGHHYRITDGKLRLEQGRLTLALQMGQVPRSLRADMSSVPSFSCVRQTNGSSED